MKLSIQSQPILRTVNTAKMGNNMLRVSAIGYRRDKRIRDYFKRTEWGCYEDGAFVDKVTIWWGHTTGDALWACNQWRSLCQGGRCNRAYFLRFTNSL